MNPFYVTFRENVEVFNATSEILKLIIRKKEPSQEQRRLYCFHSWRSVIKGNDYPLDEIEKKYFLEQNIADIHLVSNETHINFIQKHFDKPAIILPLTVFQDPSIYYNLNLKPDYDICFSCLFTDDHILRKNTEMFFQLLDKYPNLRVVWVGGYNPYERWCMENAFNDHFEKHGKAPTDWKPLWTERESMLCWQHGGGVFAGEIQKQKTLYELLKHAHTNKYNIVFYANLNREQMVHILNRSKCSITLSTMDQWPRCITEPLACGTPAIVRKDLISGNDLVTADTGIIAEPEIDSLYEAYQTVSKFDRNAVMKAYYSEWGLINSANKLIENINSIDPDWCDIVSIQRPAETHLKKSIRSELEW